MAPRGFRSVWSFSVSIRWCLLLVGTFPVCVLASCSRRGIVEKEWDSARPVDVGLDPKPLHDLSERLSRGEFENLHGVLVVRHGKLVFEAYPRNLDAQDLHYTASVSKSVGSILFGVAYEDGAFQVAREDGLDTLLLSLLPEYAEFFEGDSRKGEIRLRHVLTMSAGLQWDEQTHPYDDARNDWRRASQSEDPVAFALDRPVTASPGAEFNYNGGLSILLAYLVQRDLGMTVEELAVTRLFKVLGIRHFEWERLRCGLTDTDGGLHLRPRDMAKIGQLFLNGGEYDGVRVVSSEWVRESTRAHVRNTGSPDYGFQWWCGDYRSSDGIVTTFLASGHGGQAIYVFPTLDMVVVLVNQVFDNPFGDVNNMAILGNHVLPAADPSFGFPESIELDSATLADYVGRYGGGDETVNILLREGRLVAQAPGTPEMVLTPVAPHRFIGTVLNRARVSFEFELPRTGREGTLRAWFGFTNDCIARVPSETLGRENR